MACSVEILDVMGTDLTVVNAARVSFAKESKEFSEQDGKLVRYLAKHNHISPFFHPQIQFRLKMPIFVAREWFRHTIGFARNEVSRRYVDTDPEFFMPEGLRARDKNLKQGSKEELISENDSVMGAMNKWNQDALAFYKNLLASGVCPEQARMVLPQSMLTEFYETGSLAAYARLCKLRLDPHAQKEIRDVADQISELLRKQFPVCWAALMGEAAATAMPSA